ncbi:RhoGAP-domain-containing protein [Metschnikowia bicuspidata]|uniref:RhoGAP-domain-containing protein n=1 Tax=Metschnikowia bicuspidata TaxID=27322 RepID=A0A4P9ZFS2_9ASCO|nr:RhoGAP-domain-containing protein [Metschnikowia bicuspidata]
MIQSANRSSLLGWVKTLKRSAALHDGTEDADAEAVRPELISPDTAAAAGTPDLRRPLISHKSRSTHNLNHDRSLPLPNFPEPDSSFHEIRQHRDTFLQSNLLIDKNSQYFGVPLQQAVKQAAAKISILGADSAPLDDVLHYGRIPIVVAKCGVYLKRSGLNVEGIFRVAGSSKRIKELQIIFNTPPLFGKKLDWDGFTVHDAASVLRRYLNALPEPLIMLDLYEEFRDVLRIKPRIIKYLKFRAENLKDLRLETPVKNGMSMASRPASADKPPPTYTTASPPVEVSPADVSPVHMPSPKKSPTQPALLQSMSHTNGGRKKSYKKLTRDMYTAIREYKELLDQLPSLSKQLLFYILDLLAMVQNYSQENLMSARNLAAIFQPSILLHPNHDMDPEEYALSQSVVEFLIQYMYKILPSSDAPAKGTCTRGSSHTVATDAHPRRFHSKSLCNHNSEIDMIGRKSSVQDLDTLGLAYVDATSDDGDRLQGPPSRAARDLLTAQM